MKKTINIFFLIIVFFLNSVNLSNPEMTRVEEISTINSFVFDLADSKPIIVTDGGAIRSSNIGNFPALAHLGVSYNLVNLEPCGINSPHTHPRGTELSFVIKTKFYLKYR